METLYEDAGTLAVAKPAGVTVIPARNEPPEQCLQLRLEAARGAKLWVVHRIDRDTSGVVLFAKTAAAHRALSMAFEGREVTKTYLAWTRGLPTPSEGTIEVPLHSARKGRMRPALPGEEGALPSKTTFRSLHSRLTGEGPIACVEASPHTGRQHQLRVHLRSVGAPLLVDPLYGRCDTIASEGLGPASPALSRLTLHAHRITFVPPGSPQPLTIEAPLPPDLDALDRWMRG